MASEITGVIGTELETGLTGNVSNCAVLTVSNGTVASYPTCTITCNSGYHLNGTSCIKDTSTSSGGGGGGALSSACTSVVYSDWDNFCTGNFQYRSVISKSPNNCYLSTAQQLDAYRSCQITATSTDSSNGQSSDNNASDILSGDSLKQQTLEREKKRLSVVDVKLSKRLSGKILLQVEENGEAWYIYPVNLKRYYLGRPADAFALMRSLGLGVKHEIITAKSIPTRLYGQILIDVEDHGKAYWINPVNGSKNYLGRPADAFKILKQNGLGINNISLNKINLGE